MEIKTTSSETPKKKPNIFKRAAKGGAKGLASGVKGAGAFAKGLVLKNLKWIRNSVIIGIAAAASLPLWKVDGFPNEREAGWKKVKKYYDKYQADTKAGKYYQEQREKLKELKEQRGIKDVQKDAQDVKAKIVTEKNQIIEKYQGNSKGWREEIAKEKGMPVDYINDVIDRKHHLTKKNIDDGNKLLAPYSIEMLRDAGDVLDRDVDYKPEGVSNETSSLHETPELDFADDVEYTELASHEVDLGNGARGIDHGDGTLQITDFGVNAQSMKGEAVASQTPSKPRVQARTFNA